MVARVISRRKFICIGNSKMVPYTVVEFESNNFLQLRISFQWIFSGPGFLHTFYTHKASIHFQRKEQFEEIYLFVITVNFVFTQSFIHQFQKL